MEIVEICREFEACIHQISELGEISSRACQISSEQTARDAARDLFRLLNNSEPLWWTLIANTGFDRESPAPLTYEHMFRVLKDKADVPPDFPKEDRDLEHPELRKYRYVTPYLN